MASRPLQDSKLWLEDAELSELNEEWIDKTSARSDLISDKGSDLGSLKNTYGTILIHENAPSDLNHHHARRDITPEWKKALQQAKNPTSYHEEDKKKWNNFFESPSIHEHEVSKQDDVELRHNARAHAQSSLAEDTSSKLKVFQKYDTYTNSRLESLLGVMDSNSEQLPMTMPTRTESAQQPYNDSGSNPSFIRSANSESDLQSFRNNDQLGWNSSERRDITTQDFMDNAESLMNKLMCEVPDPARESPTEESNFQTDSFESAGSSSMDAAAYKPFEQENERFLYARRTEDSGWGSGNSERHPSVIVHSKEPEVVLSKPSENKRNIAVIKQEDVKNMIPNTIGSMNYDAKELIWRRNGKSEVSDRGDNSSAHHSTQDDDVFQGIDDLSDNMYSANFKPGNSNSQNSDKLDSAQLLNRFDSDEQESSLHRNLQSIKSCIIDTPRHLSGPLDKEVSFLLPGREARPILAAVGIGRHISGDVTNISQVDSSFHHSIKQLVTAFTNKYPNQMLWDKLDSIDISSCGLESLARLDSICPSLKTLNASRNNLCLVQGIPISVTDLNVSSNKLSNISNFGGLRNIQFLNISSNNVGSFTCLSHLIHLRKLIANNCSVTSLNGLSSIDGLLQLSIQDGLLTELDGEQFHSSLLQTLDLSNNKIKHIKNLEAFTSLRSLNVGKLLVFFFLSFFFILFFHILTI